jgi:hypothetical protein|tara:strand:+ start:464 stop:1033 length:570 start_codon:yes stop_codon:yes gene_type:complete
MYKLILHFIIFICLFGLTGCGKNFFKRADVKDVPVNVDERVKKNLEEGKGIRFGKFGKSGGTFDFASSNEMWRATVDTLDFVPLINASYSGGIIITDWFNGGASNSDNKRDLKITVKFLSNDIRSDALDVDVHERICNAQNINCTVSLIDSKISNDIKIAILKKAAFLEKNKVEKIVKENKKKRPIKSD